MQSTFKDGLNVSFKGKGITPGLPAYVENGGIRTVGGMISNDNENPAVFGTALFAVPAKPTEYFVGSAKVTRADKTEVTPSLFVGILMNRPMVNEQFPGHSDRVLNGTPADAFYQGAIWVELDAEGTNAVGSKLYANDDGTLTTATPGETSTSTSLNASVKAYDKDTGLYLVFFES